ncbi:MAG: YcxB family protein [Clostridiales bacterium]|jgi:hypothetical protein|nr:YcxB family protein [Clostridiales bacterium]
MQPVTVSFLITAPDYADFKSAAAKACLKRREIMILRAAGCLLVLASLVLCRLFGSDPLRILSYSAIALAGIAVGAFYEWFSGLFVRLRALNEFAAHKERFSAQNVEFSEEKVMFQNDRYSAAVPYEMLFKAYEDGRVFILYTGMDEMRFIPKRAMNEDECRQLRHVLQTKLQEKYQQEGAR